MLSLTLLGLYAAACLAVTVTPGPTTLLALANGASGRTAVVAGGIAGALLSDLLLIGAVGVGLGAVLAASEALFSVLKWAGVVYLGWLALQLWRAPPLASGASAIAGAASARTAFWRSLAVALSNPKGLLFFSAFLPQFIDTSAAQAPQYLALALLSALIDGVVLAAYAAGGSQAARLLTAQGLRRLHRACAVVLLSLAGLLALYRRGNA
jgi:homoserine/homoserine lactone efflux protein